MNWYGINGGEGRQRAFKIVWLHRFWQLRRRAATGVTGKAMNGKSTKKDELEVSSAQLQAELIEIKERVGALETIASISNKDVVEKFVRDNIATDKARQILRECEEPRTREHLISRF